MKTIADYNNDLVNYKYVYMAYLLSEDDKLKKDELTEAFSKLKQTTEDIKNQIKINKDEIQNVNKENIKLQNDINVLGKKVYGEQDLTVEDRMKIEKLIGDELYGFLDSEEIMDNEVKNTKLLRDLERYVSKKKHTITILSIINVILVLIIIVGLYLIISKKYLKLDIFGKGNNRNNNKL